MVARVVPVEPFDLVVFGATGDLARRKLIPAMYHRLRDGQAPADARIIGAARSELSQQAFREHARTALNEFVSAEDLDEATVATFLEMLDYVHVDAMSDDGWQSLADKLAPDGKRPLAFYLSVAPRFFGPLARQIDAFGLNSSATRIVVEKPLGHDLASARALNEELTALFDEHQIYRIDHYLGKETVHNLMALRFANALLEPLWSSRQVDHVQITVAETVGVEGRGPYYDGVGAMRDMVQNHLLQLLCLTAMEPPAKFDADMVRDEKLKVLRALAPHAGKADLVRGQYRAGPNSASYQEDAENPNSKTESFVAIKAFVENWRWAGVPFYMRTGKKLRARMSEIVVVFKEPPHSIFDESRSGRSEPNMLAIRLQPDEGVKMSFNLKDPGPGGMRLASRELDMSFAQAFEETSLRMPDAYERLVMDVIRGDQTLFMRGDEVEAAWAWIDPIIQDWEERSDRPSLYDAGSSGPEDALMLMHRDGRRWREIEV